MATSQSRSRGSSASGASNGRSKNSRPRTSAEPVSSKRSGANSGEVRRALSEREHEFAAIGLIVLGILVGLAVYARLAGPAGEGANTGLGAVLGLGRFALAPILVAMGVSLLRGDEAPSRVRLAAGWGGVVLSLLGILHVVRGPRSYTGISEIENAGGWVGAAFGETLRALIGPVGAVLVCIAVAVGSALLLTTLGLKAILLAVRDVSVNAFRGATDASGRMWEKAATLDESDHTSDHHLADDQSVDDDENEVDDEVIYDVEADEEPEVDVDPTPEAQPRSKTPVEERPATQGRLDNVKAPKNGQWSLPPASYLSKTGKQAVDQADVERRGRDLEEALSAHG
ncbi:MAG: DNA translocase FtsK 4TM domain-containing protein, partial [Actinomycetota bacterium]